MPPVIEIRLITQEELREIDCIDVDLIVATQPLTSAELEFVALLEDRAIAVRGPRLAARL